MVLPSHVVLDIISNLRSLLANLVIVINNNYNYNNFNSNNNNKLNLCDPCYTSNVSDCLYYSAIASLFKSTVSYCF